MSTEPSACLILIGNEILSGRTQDKNLSWLAEKLNSQGVQLKEARVIPDIESVIVETLNECRAKYKYVFTTGGIGPTHDDITTACVAKALGVEVERNKEAEQLLIDHYPPEKLNEARLKMADIPVGAELIPNPVSAAPGFRLENVFVMAGVPRIMQAMASHVIPQLEGGRQMLSKNVSAFVTEGDVSERLGEIQAQHSDVEIGSYPFFRERLGVSLVVRSFESSAIDKAMQDIISMLNDMDAELYNAD